MRSAGEDAINLLQEMKFRWNDNNPASVLEYDECNKYLCECEYNQFCIKERPWSAGEIMTLNLGSGVSVLIPDQFKTFPFATPSLLSNRKVR